MQIELYNTAYFHPKPPKTTSKHRNKASTYVDSVAFQEHDMPTVKELHKSTGTEAPQVEQVETIGLDTSEEGKLHADISSSKDKLFFIRFTPEGTMRARWYLIQVDTIATEELNPKAAENGIYYCGFLAKHRSDIEESNEFSR